MIRSTTARKAILLAAAALSVGALAVNCSKKDTGSNSAVGSVGLALTLPSGATVTSVHYSVKNSGSTEVAQGDIPVSDSGATISVVIGGIAAGSGYTVALSGMASDGSTCLGTSAAFAVTANASTNVNVLLLCRNVNSSGTVVVNGQIDNCPAVTSYVVSPMATGVNGHIGVSASAADLDAADTVTYAWTATAGTFNTPTASSATFTCPATSSVVTLTITVSDNAAPGSTTPKCSSSRTVVVNCGLCGNGTLDAGEQCDPPNGTTCDNSCQRITAFCGDGIVNGTEQCDPPNGTTCSATCRTITLGTGGAGTGGAGTGGAGTGGAGTGGAGTGGAGTGGAGTGGSATGGAGTGGAGTGGGATGGAGGVTAGCQTCETNICVPQGVGCSTLTGTAKTNCEAAVACVRSTHCDVDGDTSFCYCGTASQDDGSCSAAPLGLCIQTFEAADPNILPTDTVTQRFNKIAQDLVDPSLPLGKATGLIGCDAFSCNTATTCAGQF
ncbi:MAG: hypothetical protein ABJA82_01625 [Myxococcales bacterium]